MNTSDLADLYEKLCDDYGSLKQELDEAKREQDNLLTKVVFLTTELNLLIERLGPSGYRLMQELKTLRLEKNNADNNS